MPRANRSFLPGHLWHITHRCHRRDFLLKFARDRRQWRAWLFEARKRYGLRVLNYVVTSNHVHVLVYDDGRGEIARGMQLVSGRVAQQYNRRKSRRGAFWEDRYHATAVESGRHLNRCLCYIDMNMVRAGVVACPGDWPDGGYAHMLAPPTRYKVIDRDLLLELSGMTRWSALVDARVQWVDDAIRERAFERDERWSASVAVGSESYVEQVQRALGATARYRRVHRDERGCWLRDVRGRYLLKQAVK